MTVSTCWRGQCVFLCVFKALKTCGAGKSDNGGVYKPSREVYSCRAEAGHHEDIPKYLADKKVMEASLSPAAPQEVGKGVKGSTGASQPYGHGSESLERQAWEGTAIAQGLQSNTVFTRAK